jgi:uncharacterized protein YkwD
MRILLLTYVLILISILGYAQGDLVSLSNFDTERLNSYLVNYTNQLRTKKRKQGLAYYSDIDAAAKNQAQYMADRKYLGHFQKRKPLKTVKDRVKSLGGDAQTVGENVQYISINYEIKSTSNTLTYLQLATILGDNWKKSRGHYRNMLDETYTGVSHQFAIKNGLLFVCQVFTSKPFN